MLTPAIMGVEALDEDALRLRLADCDRAIAGGGDNPYFLTVRSSLRLLLGDCRGGWRDLMRAFEVDPRNMSRYAEARVSAGEHEARLPTIKEDQTASEETLLAALGRELERDPGLAEAWAWRGLMRRCVAEYPGAVADFERAWSLGIRAAWLLTWRGEARLQAGDDKGMLDLEHALELPCQAWNFAWCGRAKVAFARSPEAIACFDRALELDPRNAWYHAWRAEAKRLLRISEGIFEDFDQALALDSRGEFRGWVRTWRGLAGVQAGRWEEAIRDFGAALAAMPGYPLAHHGRAQAFFKLGRWLEWFEDFERAARLDEKYVQAQYSRSVGDIESVSTALEEVLRRKEDSAAARRWQGFFLTLMGRTEEGARNLDRAIALDPGDPWGWAWRGQLRLQTGALESALADLDRSLAADPAQPTALVCRARARLQAGRSREALLDLDTAISADSRYAWLFVERGCLRLLLGDAAGAVGDLEKAANMDRRDANALADLAVACGRSGDRGRERRLLRLALSLDAVRVLDRLRVWARHWQARGEKLTSAHRRALAVAERASRETR